MKIGYDRELRKDAEDKKFGMFTIDYEGSTFPKGHPCWRGGITVQGPMSPTQSRMLLEFIDKFKAASKEQPITEGTK